MNSSELAKLLQSKAKAQGLNYECGPDGPITSTIAVIAEAPGEREVAMKLPLVGGSGQKLWDVLRKGGFHRGNVYITNVSKRQVSFVSKRHPIGRHELDAWSALLRWELAQLPNLRYILVLGGMALRAVTGNEGIDNWRGSVLKNVHIHTPETEKIVDVICTYNPANVIRNPTTELAFRMDCDKLKRTVNGTYNDYKIEALINPTKEEALAFIAEIRAAKRLTAVDIETISGETACVGLANDPHRGMCIAFRDRTENRYSLEDEKEIRLALQDLFDDPDMRFVAQNGMFDCAWLWFKDRIRIPTLHFDTMLAHHALYPKLPHNLGFMTSQYTTHPFYKDEGKAWREGGNIDQFWEYNVKDCCITLAAAIRMAGELREQGMEKFFYGHVMRLQPKLVRMTVGGMLADIDLKEKIAADLREQLDGMLTEFHKKVQEVVGDPEYFPNPNSVKDKTDLFFNKLKLVGRGSSTDVVNRKYMYDHPRTSEDARTILRMLDELAEENKFYGTYATMRTDEDGRLRCEYKQTGVQKAPGRLSSSAVWWGTGTNLQNQPERSHPLFIADPGYVLAYFDLAQAEARLVAYYADIPVWKEQFERARLDRSYDAHRALASEMFGVPYDEVPSYDRYPLTPEIAEKMGVAFNAAMAGKVTMRFIAKRCRHGLNYRMGPETLAQTAGLPIAEAYKAHRLYHRLTPELARWWHKEEQTVRKEGALFSAYGRRWILLERMSPEALESIVAFKPQSTSGDHVSSVIYKAEDDPRWPADARMWQNNHDSLIALVPESKALHCLSIMKLYAEEPIYINGEACIIPADTKISTPDSAGIHRWSTLKSVDVQPAQSIQ